MTDDHEAQRLQERAERIHGTNPFSPEAMALDEWYEGIRERTGKIQRRTRDIEHLVEKEDRR